jgi:hypothetical protein
MDLSDLLALFNSGADGGGATPGATVPPTGQGVGAMLDAPPPPPDPLAAAVNVAPTPVTQPDDGGGVGGFLNRMIAKANARDADTGMSFVDRLGRFGSQITDLSGDTRGAGAEYDRAAQQRVADAQAEQKRAELAKLADSLGMSPREKLLFQANPEAWAKAQGEREGYHQVAGGDVGVYGEPGLAGGSVVAPPKVGVTPGGEGYAAGANGLTNTGELPVSPEQRLQAEMRAASDAALARYHDAMSRAANTRANKPAGRGLGNGGDWRGRVVGTGSIQ